MSFPVTMLIIAALGCAVAVAGYFINKRNADLASRRDAEDRDTLIRMGKDRTLQATNPDIAIDRLRITLPRSTVIGAGNSILSGMRFPEDQIIQMLRPRLVEIANREPQYEGCIIEVPMLFTFHGVRKGSTTRYAQVYVGRISGDKLTGDWRFFFGELFAYTKIRSASSESAEERLLEALLPKMDVVRTKVSADGKIP